MKNSLILSCLLTLSFSTSTFAQETNNAQPTLTVTQKRSLELNERATAEAQKGRFLQAEDLFKQALATDPYNLTAVYNLAGVYAYNKKEGEAKKLLESYLKQQPNDSELHARLGDINFSLTKVDEALSEYKKALALDPNFQGLYAKMSSIYLMKNNTKDAEIVLRIAVKEAPKNANLQRNLSAVLLANGKKEEAIATAKKALQLESSAEAYVTLGTAYEMSKDYNNALIAYKRAADLGNTSPELKNKIEELER